MLEKSPFYSLQWALLTQHWWLSRGERCFCKNVKHHPLHCVSLWSFSISIRLPSRKQWQQRDRGPWKITLHVQGTQSVFACLRVKVQAVSAFWALSAHKCIDFQVISVIRVTHREALPSMKSYFEIVWRKDSYWSIFIFIHCWLLLVSIFSVVALFCFPGIYFHVTEHLSLKVFQVS